MKSNADEQELLEKVRFSSRDERATEMLSLRLEPGYINHLNEFLDRTGVKRSDAVRAAIMALSEVAVLRALDKDREASLLAFHARRKSEKKAILHCRLEQSYLDFIDAWGAKRGINKRTAALRAILDAAQEQE